MARKSRSLSNSSIPFGSYKRGSFHPYGESADHQNIEDQQGGAGRRQRWAALKHLKARDTEREITEGHTEEEEEKARMGVLLSCCGGGSSSEYDNMNGSDDPVSVKNASDDPVSVKNASDDPETRRRKLAEAAEARMKSHEGRGLKNPEALKLRQKRIEELERKHQEEGVQPGGGLKWQVN